MLLRSVIVMCLCASVSLGAQAAPNILILGDSLSAGYGIPAQEAWPQRLSKKLAAEGYDYAIDNVSISGDTTAGARSRFAPALARSKPAIVIIALGGNDGLRGLPLSAMRDNLDTMITAAQSKGAKILLIGMRMPPNFGVAYTEKFRQVYVDLAKERKTALLPFMLEGIAEDREQFLKDGLHPTGAAHVKILANIWPQLKPLLSQSVAKK